MGKLVSILIPAYNAEKWIADTIKSALRQSWPDKEIVIVDDGSTDRTFEIAGGFKEKEVKVIRQENRGASSARNRALSCAQGDFIQWLDADDLLAPDKISRQLDAFGIDRDSRILLSSGYGIFYWHPEMAQFLPTSLWQDLKPKEFLLRKFNENVWMNPAVWMVSRKLTEVAGPWDERLSLDDDGEYFSRVIAASEEIKFVSGAKSYYRRWNTRSLSRSTSQQAMDSLILSLKLSFEYLRSLEDSERTRSACLEYLQAWCDYFCLERVEVLTGLNGLAREVGGQPRLARISGKYLLLKNLFGSKGARRIKNAVARGKLSANISWEKVIYRTGGI